MSLSWRVKTKPHFPRHLSLSAGNLTRFCLCSTQENPKAGTNNDSVTWNSNYGDFCTSFSQWTPSKNSFSSTWYRRLPASIKPPQQIPCIVLRRGNCVDFQGKGLFLFTDDLFQGNIWNIAGKRLHELVYIHLWPFGLNGFADNVTFDLRRSRNSREIEKCFMHINFSSFNKGC